MEEFSVNPEVKTKKSTSWMILSVILGLVILAILYYFVINPFILGLGLTPEERQRMIKETTSSGESFLQGEDARIVNEAVTSQGKSALTEEQRQIILESLTSGS